MFALLFSGFDTFHAQGKIRMVCRRFAIHTLPCYLILNKVMFNLAEEKVCFKGESCGWHCFLMHQLPAAMMFS